MELNGKPTSATALLATCRAAGGDGRAPLAPSPTCRTNSPSSDRPSCKRVLAIQRSQCSEWQRRICLVGGRARHVMLAPPAAPGVCVCACLTELQHYNCTSTQLLLHCRRLPPRPHGKHAEPLRAQVPQPLARQAHPRKLPGQPLQRQRAARLQPRQARRDVVPDNLMTGVRAVQLLCARERGGREGGKGVCWAGGAGAPATWPRPAGEQPRRSVSLQADLPPPLRSSPPTWDASGSRLSLAAAISGTSSASWLRQGMPAPQFRRRVEPLSKQLSPGCR